MFEKILVANRGEIAIRVLRACKEEGIRTVAVHSDVDADSLHVKLADESVCIGPAKATESYLNIPAILSAADLTDADAIHPGYGFLAETSEFAEVCEKSGVHFIGPDFKSIRLMGDKVKARKTMEKAGLPVLPGAEVESSKADKLQKLAAKIGFPIMIKAAFGGGGRGMKIVRNAKELETSVQIASNEAAQAFGNDSLYMEKFVEHPRHIEFQVLADKQGNVITLGERDCTIQRRHQKLIEEAPSPVITQQKRQEMTTLINRAIKKINYSNVGTIEFLMDEAGNLYFMEMNTRIQVEHPVTEMITGIDLIKAQLELAAGKPLPCQQKDISFRGHSIECRINAEDPVKFQPSVGTISTYHEPGGFGVRVDSSIYNDYKVLPFYDSLLAKIIVHGKDRLEAIAKMKGALGELVIDGIQCNADFHKKVMAHEQFIKGDVDTTFSGSVNS